MKYLPWWKIVLRFPGWVVLIVGLSIASCGAFLMGKKKQISTLWEY